MDYRRGNSDSPDRRRTFFRKTLGSSLESSRIRVGTVQASDVENTLNATGEVIPTCKQIIISPIRASIKSI
jgi:HlyD family secretion protein